MLTTVRVAQVGQHARFLPLYAAISKGFFVKQGLNVEILPIRPTAGPDATTAALTSGQAQFALSGPENAVYNHVIESPNKVRIIAAFSNVDGMFLVSRRDIRGAPFKWKEELTAKGRKLLAWRSGTTPGMFFDQALRNKGIDPQKDIEFFGKRDELNPFLINKFWAKNKADFATFFGTRVAWLVRNGKGYEVVSIGQEVGPVVYTIFMATTDYIGANPAIIQNWVNAIQMSLNWIGKATPDDAANTAAKFVPRADPKDLRSAFKRYREIGYWSEYATISRKAIRNLQLIMRKSGKLKKNVSYEAIVAPAFAEKAKRDIVQP